MKKLIYFVLVAILATSLLTACGEAPVVVDKEPIDVRYTEAHTELQKYTQPIWTGKAMFMIPMTRTVNHPEKWEIRWLFFYSDNSESKVWIECTESDYLAVKNYLDSGSCNGFRGLGGDSDD